MRRRLHLHPGSRCEALTGIDVEAARSRGDVLQLRYTVRGNIGGLRLPPAAISGRKDELWRHTCFEAFLRGSTQAESYCEFDFAPSTQWAAYIFESYRNGRRDLDLAAPRIEIRSGVGQFDLRAVVQASADARWKLGLAAIIEETNGNISYWALAHPPGRPDFHRDRCFALELAPDVKTAS